MRTHIGVLLISWAASGISQPIMEWQNSYGGSGSDGGYSIDETYDGGYITLSISGSTDIDVTGNHGAADLWAIKLDGDGEILWQKCLGGSAMENSMANCIRQCADGGFILIGSTWSSDGDVPQGTQGGEDIWVVKLFPNGELEWQKTFGGSLADFGFRIEELANGGFILLAGVASTEPPMQDNHGELDYWVAWLDPAGELVNSRCYGGTYTDTPRDFTVAVDGRFIFSGTTYSNDGDVSGNHLDVDPIALDAWIVSCSANGDILWQRCLGGSNNETCWGHAVASNGHVYAACTARSMDGDLIELFGEGDIGIIKLDENGVVLDQVIIGGSNYDAPYDIVIVEDGQVCVLGRTMSSDGTISDPRWIEGGAVWLLEFTSDLDLLWEKCFGGSGFEFGRELNLGSDGSLAFAAGSNSSDGDLTSNYGSSDLWVVKFLPEDVGLPEPDAAMHISIYPNPTSGSMRITWTASGAERVQVMNALGRIVHEERISAGYLRTLELDASTWADGLYTVRINGSDIDLIDRFIKD